MKKFNNLKYLIGIVGNARHGKNSVGDFLYLPNVLQLGHDHVCQFSFANPLKCAAMALFDRALDKNEQVPSIGLTGRQIYQRMGDGLKHAFGEDIFIRLADAGVSDWLEQSYLNSKKCAVVFTDVRFQEEADWILRNNGTLIHVRRADVPVDRSHVSERFPAMFAGYPAATIWRDKRVFFVQNDGTLDDLRVAVEQIRPKIMTCAEAEVAVARKPEEVVVAKDAVESSDGPMFGVKDWD